MNKYSLIIEEKTEEPKSFNTKPIITIEGNSLLELFGKLPLEIHNYMSIELTKAFNKINEDDIPF